MNLKPTPWLQTLQVFPTFSTPPTSSAPPAVVDWAQTRVIKKIASSQPGALKLARRYGDALVCVRHRHDASGQTRFTTIELVIDQAPVQPSRASTRIVALHLKPTEGDLRRQVIAHGGQWDPQLQAWRTTQSVARRLRLLDRVIAR